MAVRTEYGEIIAEMDRKAKPKLPAIERAAWLWRPKAKPEPDHFAWRDPFAAAPEITDTGEDR